MKKRQSPSAEVRGAMAALKRSARRARELAETTGTQLLVMRGGKIININPNARPHRSRRASGSR